MKNKEKSGAASAAGLRRILPKALLAVSVVLLLGAAAVYAVLEYQGVQAQQRAEKLLTEATTQDDTVLQADNAIRDTQPQEEKRKRVLSDLTDYSVIAKITIPELSIELPVIEECSPEALEVSVCRLFGPYEPGDDGNLVITGHNYRSGAHFGRLDEIKAGDSVVLMDVWGDEYVYQVAETLVILPTEIEALGVTNAQRSLDLLTCTNNANARLLVRCVQADN